MSIETRGQPAALIVNTRSRSGARYFRAAHRELKRCGVNLTASYPVAKERDLLRVARAAAEDNSLLIVGGGDGTLSSVVDFLVGRDVVLGLLPLGTGNDFARSLGIPFDLDEACRTVAEGHVQTASLGRVNGNYFVNSAVIGYPGHVNHAVPDWLKRMAGKAAYVAGALWAVLNPRPFKAVIVADGARFEVETTMVTIGNGRFYAPTRRQLPSGAEADRLIVQAPRNPTRTSMMHLATEYGLRGRLIPDLMMSAAGYEISVETDPPQEVDVDGEMGGWTPARASLAGSLRVLTPRTAEEAQRLDEQSHAA